MDAVKIPESYEEYLNLSDDDKVRVLAFAKQLKTEHATRHDARLTDAEHDAALAGGDGPEARDRINEDRWGREEGAERRRDR